MTSAATPPNSSASAAPAWQIVRRYANRAGRLLLVLWLFWFGGWTIITLQELLGDDSPTTTTATPTDSALASSTDPSSNPAAMLETFAALDAGGRWAFIDGPWSLGVLTLSTNELASYWSKSPADPREFAAAGQIETTVLDLVRSMEMKPRTHGRRTHYLYESPGVMAEVSTAEVAAHPRLCWARLAIATAPGEWKVLETRAGNSAVIGQETFDIPVPKRTSRLAARYDTSGALRGEFLLIEATQDQVLNHWHSTGCTVTPADLDAGDLEGAATNPNPTRRYVLALEGRTIQALVWNSQSPGQTMLLTLPTSPTAPIR